MQTDTSSVLGRFTPMLLSSSKTPFFKDGWIFEPKLDGMRAIGKGGGGNCSIRSRNGLEYNKHFPALSAEVSRYDRVVFEFCG